MEFALNRFTPVEMEAELGLMINAKRNWLATHGKRSDWPEWDKSVKTKELAVLEQARAAYRAKNNASSRKNG